MSHEPSQLGMPRAYLVCKQRAVFVSIQKEVLSLLIHHKVVFWFSKCSVLLATIA
jgi:hypothetical protein